MEGKNIALEAVDGKFSMFLDQKNEFRSLDQLHYSVEGAAWDSVLLKNAVLGISSSNLSVEAGILMKLNGVYLYNFEMTNKDITKNVTSNSIFGLILKGNFQAE